MKSFSNIANKLEQFIRKYYTNELIKGTILFVAIGLLYLIITLLIEYFLWLKPLARTILFWVFIAVELGLFVKFIINPLTKLFKLREGINYEDASRLIGAHFPEVNDKLLNVLQLQATQDNSELIIAGIEQKSAELNPIPFKLAVNFKTNTKYLKYAAIPIVILLLSYVTGKFNWFSDSYERVVNYQTAYEPPAPFKFFVLNNPLQATQNQDFTVEVKTIGDTQPEFVTITYNNQSYRLQKVGANAFQYTFSQPRTTIDFKLSANSVSSKSYTLNVVEVPALQSFEMVLDYPAYTKKRDEVLKSTGNAVVPQGTVVTWKVNTKSTDAVRLYAKDTLHFKAEENGMFKGSKRVYKSLNYSLTTSNANLPDYENLAFSIDVIKDDYPELKVNSKTDSLDLQTLYFHGQASDDYGLTKLQLVYYPSDNESAKQYKTIPLKGKQVTDFIDAFPDALEIEEGVSYQLYFQAFDNDAVNKPKPVKSQVFNYRKRTQKEEQQKQLNAQNETIKDMDKTLDRFSKQEKQLEEISKTQKEKTELNFNDKKKLEQFIKRQKQQEQMMQQFNKEMQDNLEQFNKDEEDTFKEDLKKRLEDNAEKLKQDEKLLEELQKLQDKINKEEFNKKLDDLAKQTKNQKRSLQQLLELTKRYYVTQKLEQLRQQLEDLAKAQEALSKAPKDENTKAKQDELNKRFEDHKEGLKQLQKDNQKLVDPLKLPNQDRESDTIDQEQQNASEQLEQNEQSQDAEQKQNSMSKAQQSQKRAAQKMQQLSQQMQQAMEGAGGGGEQQQEDMETLRQILDNLVVFSFDQEGLMDRFKAIEINHSKYPNYLKQQYNLREHFEHIDDSLFALSMRQPKISENINTQITEVYYNIDKSLGEFSENRLYGGIKNQQYTLTAANTLADFLSQTLDNMQMQMQMSGSGQGSGQGMGKGSGQGESQLPDIIMSQEELNKQMQEGLQKSQSGQPKEGEGESGESKGEQGEPKEGKDGKKPGEEGESGKEGKDGKGKKPGEGDGQGGNGEGEQNKSEYLNGELYKIYQQQQQLREQLKDKLAKDGLTAPEENVLKQMEQIEDQLINKGFNQRTLSKMLQLKHQLLKLEDASFKQGQDNKRESKTNTKAFNNTTNSQLPTARQYFNTTEILNRQALPLQPIYKQKVQEYFKQSND